MNPFAKAIHKDHVTTRLSKRNEATVYTEGMFLIKLLDLVSSRLVAFENGHK